MMDSLIEIAKPVLLTGAALSGRSDAEALQAELLRELASFDAQARKLGFSAAVVEEARYALAAWLDEMVFHTSPISIEWLGHSLAVRLYQDQAAGAAYFDRMKGLHQKAEMLPALEVYSACIMLGFKGRYRIEEPEELTRLVEEVLGKKPSSWDAAPWFPALRFEAGRRPKERTGRRLLIGAAILTTLSLLFYVALAFLAQALS